MGTLIVGGRLHLLSLPRKHYSLTHLRVVHFLTAGVVHYPNAGAMRCLPTNTPSPLDRLHPTPEPPPLPTGIEMLFPLASPEPSAAHRFLNFLRLRWRDAFLAFRRPSTA